MRNKHHPGGHEQRGAVKIKCIASRKDEANRLLVATHPLELDQQTRQHALRRRRAKHDQDFVFDVTQEAPKAEPSELRDQSEHHRNEHDHKRVETQHELRERDQNSATTATDRIGDGAESSDGGELHHEVDKREKNLRDVVEAGVDLFTPSLWDREDSDSNHDSQDNHLKQFALCKGANEIVGHHVHDKFGKTLWSSLGGRGGYSG